MSQWIDTVYTEPFATEVTLSNFSMSGLNAQAPSSQAQGIYILQASGIEDVFRIINNLTMAFDPSGFVNPVLPFVNNRGEMTSVSPLVQTAEHLIRIQKSATDETLLYEAKYLWTVTLYRLDGQYNPFSNNYQTTHGPTNYTVQQNLHVTVLDGVPVNLQEETHVAVTMAFDHQGATTTYEAIITPLSEGVTLHKRNDYNDSQSTNLTIWHVAGGTVDAGNRRHFSVNGSSAGTFLRPLIELTNASFWHLLSIPNFAKVVLFETRSHPHFGIPNSRLTIQRPISEAAFFSSCSDSTDALWTAVKDGNGTQIYSTRRNANDRETLAKIPDMKVAALWVDPSFQIWAFAFKASEGWKLWKSTQYGKANSFQEVGMVAFSANEYSNANAKYLRINNVVLAIAVEKTTKKLKFRLSPLKNPAWGQVKEIGTLQKAQQFNIEELSTGEVRVFSADCIVVFKSDSMNSNTGNNPPWTNISD